MSLRGNLYMIHQQKNMYLRDSLYMPDLVAKSYPRDRMNTMLLLREKMSLLDSLYTFVLQYL
jgi:hypothetical protein